MITSPYAEKERLAFELRKWKPDITMTEARILADTVISALESGPVTPLPWEVLHHPMTHWVAEHFEVHWPRAGAALTGIVPGKPDPGPGPGPDPNAVIHETVPVVHNTIEVIHT